LSYGRLGARLPRRSGPQQHSRRRAAEGA